MCELIVCSDSTWLLYIAILLYINSIPFNSFIKVLENSKEDTNTGKETISEKYNKVQS